MGSWPLTLLPSIFTVLARWELKWVCILELGIILSSSSVDMPRITKATAAVVLIIRRLCRIQPIDLGRIPDLCCCKRDQGQDLSVFPARRDGLEAALACSVMSHYLADCHEHL